MNEYDFTRDHVTPHISSWKKVYEYLSNNFGSDLNCLEIGTFEGKSAIYFLDNFTGDNGKLTVIDNFWDKTYESRYNYNINNNIKSKQVVTLKGSSLTQLPILYETCPESFDFIYLDAGKTSVDNMYNMLMAERLLKVGGLLIVDDYYWHLTQPHLELKETPHLAIKAFMDITLLCDWYEAPKHQAIIIKRNPNSIIK